MREEGTSRTGGDTRKISVLARLFQSAGQRIPDRGQVRSHTQVHVLEKAVKQGFIKLSQGHANGHQIQRLSGFNRAIDKLARVFIDIIELMACVPERFEKAEIGRIGHCVGLSGPKSAPVYRWAQ